MNYPTQSCGKLKFNDHTRNRASCQWLSFLKEFWLMCFYVHNNKAFYALESIFENRNYLPMIPM